MRRANVISLSIFLPTAACSAADADAILTASDGAKASDGVESSDGAEASGASADADSIGGTMDGVGGMVDGVGGTVDDVAGTTTGSTETGVSTVGVDGTGGTALATGGTDGAGGQDDSGATGTTVGSVDPGRSPLKVFILAGQSNMVGYGTVEGESTPGTLEYVVENEPDKWGHLKDENGDWVMRDDVWIWCKRTNKRLAEGVASPLEGPLTAGQGFDDPFIGPELAFGNVLGDHYDEQVLIIKHAWGGTAVGNEWLSPSQPGYMDPQCCERSNRSNPGFYYQLMFHELRALLDDIGATLPEYDEEQGYEIVGFGWHQGFNDQFDGLADAYEANLVRLIGDIRDDIGIEDLPFVIGASEHAGNTISNQIRPAQLNIGDPARYPEFVGNLVTTGGNLLQPESESPTREGAHYHRNARTYLLIGEAMAQGMIGLVGE